MSKYEMIIDYIKESCGDTEDLDEIYIMGLCHAVQFIVNRDDTINIQNARDINSFCQSIINDLIRI